MKNLITILILFCLSFSFEKHNIDENNFNHSSVFDSKYNKINKLFYNTTLNRDYNLLEFESHYWNNYEWINSGKYLYTYDNYDNQIDYIYQTWNELDWLNYFKSTYTYNEDNNLIESLNYIWNGLDWDIPSGRIVFQYDNGNQIEQLYQLWDNDNLDWINYSKYSYLYDDYNNQVEDIYQTWNESDWLNYSKYSYLYDEDNNLIEYMSFLWDGDGYDWNISGRLTNYIYEENNLDIDFEDDIINLSYNLHNPYPNPFNPTTTISFSVPTYDFVSIKVYDINGGLVSTLVEDHFNQGTHSLTWDGTHLSSGQYLVKMESGSFSKTQIVSLIK